MTVRAVRDGQTVTLQSAHLAVGDVVLLSAGDKVPADGRLLESTALQVDESALTGESFPVKKDSSWCLRTKKRPWRSGPICFIAAHSLPRGTDGCW